MKIFFLNITKFFSNCSECIKNESNRILDRNEESEHFKKVILCSKNFLVGIKLYGEASQG